MHFRKFLNPNFAPGFFNWFEKYRSSAGDLEFRQIQDSALLTRFTSLSIKRTGRD